MSGKSRILALIPSVGDPALLTYQACHSLGSDVLDYLECNLCGLFGSIEVKSGYRFNSQSKIMCTCTSCKR